MKHHARQTEIDAVQWNGSMRIFDEFFPKPPKPVKVGDPVPAPLVIATQPKGDLGILQIETPNGTIDAVAGDWIIRDAKGNYASCSDAFFRLLFEPAKEPVTPKAHH